MSRIQDAKLTFKRLQGEDSKTENSGKRVPLKFQPFASLYTNRQPLEKSHLHTPRSSVMTIMEGPSFCPTSYLSEK